MQEEKLDTSLQIALEALQEGMNTNRDLLYGYDPESESFRVIIKYNGDIKKIEEEIDILESQQKSMVTV